MDMNTVQVVGRLTGDPEVKHLANDNAVGKFQLATNRVWYNAKREKQEDSAFIPVEVWGSTAKVLERFCHKGSEVGVIGRLKLDMWDDKETGEKRSKLLVLADHLSLGNNCGENGASSGNQQNRFPEKTNSKKFVKKESKEEVEGVGNQKEEESVTVPPNKRLF